MAPKFPQVFANAPERGDEPDELESQQENGVASKIVAQSDFGNQGTHAGPTCCPRHVDCFNR